MLDIARQRRPFMMNVQSNAETRAPHGPLPRSRCARPAATRRRWRRNVEQCWVWRNVCVAETDAEAARIALPAFEAMQEHRSAMREQVYREQGVSLVPMPAPGAAPPARTQVEHSLIYGSPATVAEKLAQVTAIGVGGVIMQFRLGPMSYDDTAQSLTLFRRKVAPADSGGCRGWGSLAPDSGIAQWVSATRNVPRAKDYASVCPTVMPRRT